ncbi:hypothetical protein Vretimale_5132 [Volvox reticuliferus]|uniref:Uncharacterized protein n=1 Tax=Volvox reticuliferus TaxID=1737510 RepID=A0A8J4DGS9_9CHLO|nr:hypothetical protein Vretimale_5132 [Volvox reticuliferus]
MMACQLRHSHAFCRFTIVVFILGFALAGSLARELPDRFGRELLGGQGSHHDGKGPSSAPPKPKELNETRPERNATFPKPPEVNGTRSERNDTAHGDATRPPNSGKGGEHGSGSAPPKPQELNETRPERNATFPKPPEVNGTRSERNDTAHGDATRPPNSGKGHGRDLLSSKGGERGSGSSAPKPKELNETHPERNATFPKPPEVNGTRSERNDTAHGDATRPPNSGKGGEHGSGSAPPKAQELNETRPERNATFPKPPEVNGTRPERNDTSHGDATRPPNSGKGGEHGSRSAPPKPKELNGSRPPAAGHQESGKGRSRRLLGDFVRPDV